MEVRSRLPLVDDNGMRGGLQLRGPVSGQPRYLQQVGEQLAINEGTGVRFTQWWPVCLGPESTPTCLSGYFLVNVF